MIDEVRGGGGGGEREGERRLGEFGRDEVQAVCLSGRGIGGKLGPSVGRARSLLLLAKPPCLFVDRIQRGRQVQRALRLSQGMPKHTTKTGARKKREDEFVGSVVILQEKNGPPNEERKAER